MSWKDEKFYFQRAYEVSVDAFKKGNDPFGAILVDKDGEIILEQMNECGSGDQTAHDAIRAISKASLLYSKEFLWDSTLYATIQPCCMCVGAAYWANLGNIKYVMSEKELGEILGGGGLDLPSEDVIARGDKDIKVTGPFDPLRPAVKDLILEWKKSWG